MSTSSYSQKKYSSLSDVQLSLAACAALEAQGDLLRLDVAIRNALDSGVTVNQLKEAFSQLYAYTGFPRSLNALGVLQNVISSTPYSENIGKYIGEEWKRPDAWNDSNVSLRLGTENQTKLSGRPFNYDFCPQNDYYLKCHLFGDIFAGEQLSNSDRELVTVAALSALKGVSPQLAAHKKGAVNMGNSQLQVDELCQYLSDSGLSQVDCSSDANAGAWPKGDPNNAYSKFFVGNSHLAPIVPKNLQGEKTSTSWNNVTFEPGCRNNWHVHYGARQILICVSGHGWYQEWGKKAIQLNPGDIIDVPEGVKHWHGAQRDSWFQHVTTHIEVPKSKPDKPSNEWLEPVDDDSYNSL